MTSLLSGLPAFPFPGAGPWRRTGQPRVRAPAVPRLTSMTASGRRVPSRLSIVCQWLSVLAAVPVLVMSVFRAVGAEWPVLVVQLLAFTPWLAVPAGVALVLSLFGGRREPQVVAAALLVCQLFWLFPLDIARPIPAAAAAAAAPAASPADCAKAGVANMGILS